MRRREFIAALGSAAVGWPLAVAAQEAGRNYRVAGLFGASSREAPQTVAMFEEVRQAGFIEGRNLTVDWRTYGTHVELVSQFASELFKSPVDVIVVGGDPATKAAQQATTTIPILAFTDDMVGSGLVSSLAKHGGNTTGVSLLATELDGKRQDILIEAVPGLRRMAALADITTTPHHFQALQDEAGKRGIELLIQSVAKPDEIAPAINAAKASDVAALNVLASPLLFANRQIIIERAARLRLPAMYQWPEVAEESGFVGYGPRIVQLYRDILGRQLVQLLRGAKAADLPVEQPTKFELVINLRTAKAVGVEIPAALVLRADKLVE
jgi:ABC-type uncharacterized transport system substrate-binding protein